MILSLLLAFTLFVPILCNKLYISPFLLVSPASLHSRIFSLHHSFLSLSLSNDLDLGLSSKVSKFADDTKLGINAANPESVRALQRDLAAIREWSTVWQMPFNLDKCHVLHVGTANQEENYSLLGWTRSFRVSLFERHLRITSQSGPLPDYNNSI